LQCRSKAFKRRIQDCCRMYKLCTYMIHTRTHTRDATYTLYPIFGAVIETGQAHTLPPRPPVGPLFGPCLPPFNPTKPSLLNVTMIIALLVCTYTKFGTQGHVLAKPLAFSSGEPAAAMRTCFEAGAPALPFPRHIAPLTKQLNASPHVDKPTKVSASPCANFRTRGRVLAKPLRKCTQVTPRRRPSTTAA
jgi:hypothetical protein